MKKYALYNVARGVWDLGDCAGTAHNFESRLHIMEAKLFPLGFLLHFIFLSLYMSQSAKSLRKIMHLITLSPRPSVL